MVRDYIPPTKECRLEVIFDTDVPLEPQELSIAQSFFDILGRLEQVQPRSEETERKGDLLFILLTHGVMD